MQTVWQRTSWKREPRFVSFSLSPTLKLTFLFSFQIALQNQKLRLHFHLLLLLLILQLFTVSEPQTPNAIFYLIGYLKTTTLFGPSPSMLEPLLSLPYSSIVPSPTLLPLPTLAGSYSLSLLSSMLVIISTVFSLMFEIECWVKALIRGL